MKTILVATDFTPASTNALSFAVKLARPFNAKVILFHAYLSEVYVPDFVLLPTELNIHQECEHLLKAQVQMLEPKERVFVETRCEPGYAPDAILQKQQVLAADVIVVGLKKNDLGLKKVFGSTAFPVYRNAMVPVLAIPENIEYRPLKNIALASDLLIKNNPHVLDMIMELIDRLHCKLNVVNVVSGRQQHPGLEAAYEMNLALKEYAPKYHFIESREVAKALSDFVEEGHMDLLAVVAHPHTVFERMFVKSNIRQLMFEGQVPLMILPDRLQNNIHNKPGTERLVA